MYAYGGSYMFPSKIKLTPDYINLIIQKRKDHDLTAYQLSEKIGKNKSWLPNVENRRTKNISKEDFLALFKDFAAEESMDTEMYIIKYLNPQATVELDDGSSLLCRVLQKMYHLNQSSILYMDNRLNLNDMYTEDSCIESLKKSIIELQNTLETTLITEEAPKPAQLFTALKNIRYSFMSDYDLSLRIFNINFFAGIDVDCQNNFYSSEIKKLVDEMECRFRLTNQRQQLYDYFLAPGENANLSYRINSCSPISSTKLNELLNDIDNYINILSQYIYDLFNSPYRINTDFHKFYTVADNFCKDFIRVSKLQYTYSFDIPSNDSSESEIKEAQLQINQIIFLIRKMFQHRYNIK